MSETGFPLSANVPMAAGWSDALWSGLLRRVAGQVRRGHLTLHLPDRAPVTVGDGSGPAITLAVHRPAVARRLLAGGDLGLAEAYLDGWWDCDDLTGLLLLGLRNEAALADRISGWAPHGWINRLIHRRNANTKRGSRRNIAFHYDLGNDFYRAWLDAGMMYSSALYQDPADSLEQAQAAKLARAAELMQMQPGLSVLEIGCGWGGMAEILADGWGVQPVCLTLSAEQRAYAMARLGDRAEVRLQDYRDVTGQFDRIVSLEMIEAVGEEHWPRYFATLRDRLRPGGSAVLQAIMIEDRRFDSYRRGCDFIQRYVFPGGMLPSPAAIRDQAARAGLVVEHAETFGDSYALTLAEWRRRFVKAWPTLSKLGFDERFRRLWTYYLCYCEAGFRAGAIDVGFWRLRRP